ncbi:TPA: restriction endonuclease subunit S [Haemophilus influenzae]
MLKGEFLINPLNLNYDLISLRIALSEIDVVVSAGYIVLKEKQIINKKYFSYLLHRYDVAYMKLLGSGVRQTINYGHISDSILVIPPLSEQQKIAQFLDDKTAKIDRAVDLAEKQIALLKEHKQILIQNAVTRGLNPDVPLKDSGVEWIGQVPEHWDIKRFRNLFDFGKGLSITKENLQDEGIPCVNYGEVHSRYGFEVIPKRDALKCVDSKYLVFNNSMLNKGDFVFADTSEDIEGSGNFTYLNSSTRIFAGYHTVITRLKITAIHRYIAYYFDSLSFRNQIRNKVKGVKVFSITQSILKGTFVLLPNLKEQQQIADYLDTQTAKIDQAIALKTAHIEKLKEYKSVLINDVVTGKVRV